MTETIKGFKNTGRPQNQLSEGLDTLILKTASRLFGAQGYAATCVEQIAAVALHGKQIIYCRYLSKKNVFKIIIPELGKSFFMAAEPPAFDSARIKD